MQRFQRGDFLGQQPYAAGDRGALVVDVGAESPDRRASKAQIGVAATLKLLLLRGRKQREKQGARVVGSEGGAGKWREGSIDAESCRSASDEDEVRRSALAGLDQEL